MPPVTGNEIAYITDAIRRREFEAYNHYTSRCQAWLQKQVGARDVLLTHSCTAALEMAAILADLEPGDEVIMPSYTFTSTATAVVLRGAIPVFVDIRTRYVEHRSEQDRAGDHAAHQGNFRRALCRRMR